MPKIEELQLFHWGSAQPTAVELATDRVNVAIGPNGSGKTSFLDAIKLLLGVTKLKQTPTRYIYNGGPVPDQRAQKATIKATFANPPGEGGLRQFAHAGRGCGTAAHVTALCEVTAGERRYVMLAGHRSIGTGETGATTLPDLLSGVPRNWWMGPDEWASLMASAGVSQALLSVIAVEQGQTARILEGSPTELLTRLLELTGKQETLTVFEKAKIGLTQARDDAQRAEADLERATVQLERLQLADTRRKERETDERELERLRTVLVPAARHLSARTARDEALQERDRERTRLQGRREELEGLRQGEPEDTKALEAVESQEQRLETLVGEAYEALSRADTEQRSSSGTEAELIEKIAAAREALGDRPLAPTTVEDARVAHAHATETHRMQIRERDVLTARHAALEAGRFVVPDDVEQFSRVLEAAAVRHGLVAEALDSTDDPLVEAALGEHRWALWVDERDHSPAVALATAEGFRRPLAATSAAPATPTGTLARAEAPDELGPYLDEIDLPAGVPGLDDNGVLHGRHFAWNRRPETPVLGARARADEQKQVASKLELLNRELPVTAAALETSKQYLDVVASGWEAHERLDAVTKRRVSAEMAVHDARNTTARLREELRTASRAVGQLRQRQQERAGRLVTVEAAVQRHEDRLGELRAALTKAEEALLENPPVDEALPEALEPLEVLRSRVDGLERRLGGTLSTDADARDPALPARLQAQEQRVKDARQLSGDSVQEVDEHVAQVADARDRYERHITQVIRRLGTRFRDICATANMEGQLEPVVQEDGTRGVDVKVAHVQRDALKSYRSGEHSTGERAKIAILVLLAAMGLERHADLLVMDEQFAHLDSGNVDAIADVMVALQEQVQFILATPSNAEARRLSWADHHLAFWKRADGEAYAPAVQILTGQPEDPDRYIEPQLVL
jgi:chromosome segregation ATPase